MATNEAGLSGGKEQGSGGNSPFDQKQGVGGGNSVTGEANPPGDRSTGEGHLGRGGDPVEGRKDPAATGQGPAKGEGA